MDGTGGGSEVTRAVNPATHSTNRSSVHKRLKRRKNRRFKGRKERLREEVKILKKENEVITKKSLVLSQQLKRNITQISSIAACKTKATNIGPSHSSTKYTLAGVRQFSSGDTKLIKSSVLGQGAFGKCILGFVGPLKVCIKVCKTDYNAYFYREVQMLMRCCHSNLPILHGVCVNKFQMIIMSFHGFGQDSSLSLHSAICAKSCSSNSIPAFSIQQWKNILCGVVSAIHYLHHQQILHNDIKGDNIVIEKSDTDIRSVVIDLGKACYVNEAKKYSLSKQEKLKYVSDHPQIAPDLRDGETKQCESTDVYSVGRIIDVVNKKHLTIPALYKISESCLQYQSAHRPLSSELYTSLTFILQ